MLFVPALCWQTVGHRNRNWDIQFFWNHSTKPHRIIYDSHNCVENITVPCKQRLSVGLGDIIMIRLRLLLTFHLTIKEEFSKGLEGSYCINQRIMNNIIDRNFRSCNAISDHFNSSVKFFWEADEHLKIFGICVKMQYKKVPYRWASRHLSITR